MVRPFRWLVGTSISAWPFGHFLVGRPGSQHSGTAGRRRGQNPPLPQDISSSLALGDAPLRYSRQLSSSETYGSEQPFIEKDRKPICMALP